MPRLLAVLLVICGLLLGACGEAEQDDVAATLARAAEATKGLGMELDMNGSVTVDGISQPLRGDMTVAPNGRRARISMQIAGMRMVQYLDGSAMLMDARTFGGAAGFPAGTRWLRFDLDAVNRAAGLNVSLREMQSMDPAKAAAMMADIADVTSVGRGNVGGVAVTRYGADVDMSALMEKLAGGKVDAEVKKMMGSGKMHFEFAIDDAGRIRAYSMAGVMGPATTDMQIVVTRYAPALDVELPTKGVRDVTDALVAATQAGGSTP